MDQTTARKLFEEGAFFLFLDVPEGTEFGIDMKAWNTCEKFRGIKMIPPGLHYVFYASVGSLGDTSPRKGFFHHFKKQEFLVKKWDKILEDVSQESVPEEETVKLKENIQLMDKFLAPYPYEILDKWKSLTSNITVHLVENLTPLCGYVSSAIELENCTDENRPRGKQNSESDSETPGSSSKRSRQSRDHDDFLPSLRPREGTDIRFTPFPERNYPEGATPSQITKHSLDSSYVLETMIRKYKTITDILGELEYCFVCFLIGHSLEAFENWKKLFSLFCSCEDTITTYRRLYDLFFTIINIQVSEIPEEFLADIVSNNNFVYVKLKHLFNNIKESAVDGELKTKVNRYQQYLMDTYLWSFETEEDEDEAPVIVTL